MLGPVQGPIDPRASGLSPWFFYACLIIVGLLSRFDPLHATKLEVGLRGIFSGWVLTGGEVLLGGVASGLGALLWVWFVYWLYLRLRNFRNAHPRSMNWTRVQMLSILLAVAASIGSWTGSHGADQATVSERTSRVGERKVMRSTSVAPISQPASSEQYPSWVAPEASLVLLRQAAFRH